MLCGSQPAAMIHCSAWRPRHGAAPENMAMQMGHRLSGIRAVVEHEAKATLSQALLPCDFCRLQQDMAQYGFVFFGGSADAGYWFARNDEDMHRRARLYVAKGNDVLVLINHLRRNLPIGDLLEQRLAHAAAFLRRLLHQERAIQSIVYVAQSRPQVIDDMDVERQAPRTPAAGAGELLHARAQAAKQNDLRRLQHY